MIRIATMFTTLIIGLIAGPAVSLYGSPTVSPVTEAAWANDPLPPRFPSSINFFALSHAAPPEVIAIATNNPVTIVPTSKPPRATAPSGLIIATATTATKGNNAGTIISRKAAFVTISTQGPYSWFRLQLPAHLAHDCAGCLAYSVHAERRESERQQSAEEKSNNYFWFRQRELIRKDAAMSSDVPA